MKAALKRNSPVKCEGIIAYRVNKKKSLPSHKNKI